ncbi:GNAT family N-acetyltransferase [Kutzneria chonburiensis]|uniref:GNAT family N-acetyltransferase n=1 Tax=Kutzneria chonburiensis TaxID=1483604 RepID=A0ABV6MJV2_9PSEU|nr:GNAT family N-acetyltransferase [Kutzneria chonburiensis]
MTLDIRPFDEAEIDEYHELRLALYRHDFPELPTPTREATVSTLSRHGDRLLWTARRDQRVVGKVSVLLLDDNEHLAVVDVAVLPELRRQGIGTALLDFVLPHVRDRGCTVVEGGYVKLDGPGGSWTRNRGFREVQSTILQILELGEVDRARWAVDTPEGYELVRWRGHVPDELVASYAEARRAIADAPWGESAEHPPDWTVERVRRIEVERREQGIDLRTVAAVDTHGTVVGLTEAEARPKDPTRLMQGDTVVLKAHRGHGLGVAMKAELLRWFTAEHGALEQAWTRTAAANTYMADVNHRLGFATVGRYGAVAGPIGTIGSEFRPIVGSDGGNPDCYAG